MLNVFPNESRHTWHWRCIERRTFWKKPGMPRTYPAAATILHTNYSSNAEGVSIRLNSGPTTSQQDERLLVDTFELPPYQLWECWNRYVISKKLQYTPLHYNEWKSCFQYDPWYCSAFFLLSKSSHVYVIRFQASLSDSSDKDR